MTDDHYQGVDWQAINKAVGPYFKMHPLALVREWLSEHPCSLVQEGRIWDAAIGLMNGEGAFMLSRHTGVRQELWLHMLVMWQIPKPLGE